MLQSPVKFIRRCPARPTHEFQTRALLSLSSASRSWAQLGNGFWNSRIAELVTAQERSGETAYLSAGVPKVGPERKGACPRSLCGLKVGVWAIWPTISFCFSRWLKQFRQQSICQRSQSSGAAGNRQKPPEDRHVAAQETCHLTGPGRLSGAAARGLPNLEPRLLQMLTQMRSEPFSFKSACVPEAGFPDQICRLEKGPVSLQQEL